MFRLYTDPEDSGFQQSSFRQNKSILRTGQEEGEGTGCAFGTVSGRANKGGVASWISSSGVQSDSQKVGEVIGVPVDFPAAGIYGVWRTVPRCVCTSAKFTKVDFSNIGRSINPDPDVSLCSGISFETQTPGNLRGFAAPFTASFLFIGAGGKVQQRQ